VIWIYFRLGPAWSRSSACEAETEHDDRNAGKFNAFMFIHLVTRFGAGLIRELARTLLLMGDAEKTLESAHEN